MATTTSSTTTAPSANFVVDFDEAKMTKVHPVQEQEVRRGSDSNRPQTLEFHDIEYQVRKRVGSSKDEELRSILANVSGSAQPGQITGIAGQSGAGKSTLLDVIAGRIPLKNLKTGVVTVNGVPIDSQYRLRTGYVMQDDNLIPMLTVTETLMFAGRLRVPNFKSEMAAQLIEELGLTKSANTIIGDEQHRGISGGERRRVSIGQEMIRNPNILFLDEPTSGLDSSTAYSVLARLREIAIKGSRTVVLTVHQPSARLLTVFDKMIVLSAGQLIYNGNPANIVPYFRQALNQQPAVLSNALEFALDLADEFTAKEAPQDGAVKLIEAYKANHPVSAHPVKSTVDNGEEGFSFANGFWREAGILLERTFTYTMRTQEMFLARLFSFLMMAIIIGTLYLKLGTDSEDADSLAGFVAFTVAMYIFTSVEALPAFLMERSVFQRETSRGAYRPLSYVVAGFINALPVMFILGLAYTVVSQWLVGIEGGERFIYQVIQSFMILLAANSFVVMMSAAVPSFVIGNSACTAIFATMFLFGGFFIPRTQIRDNSPWWIWIHYISIFRYSQDGLLKNVFEGGSNYSCPPGSVEGCERTPNDILSERFGLDNTPKWADVAVLFGFALLFRTVFWLILRRLSRK